MCCALSVACCPSYRASLDRLLQEAGRFQPTRGVHMAWMAVARLEIVDGLAGDRGTFANLLIDLAADHVGSIT